MTCKTKMLLFIYLKIWFQLLFKTLQIYSKIYFFWENLWTEICWKYQFWQKFHVKPLIVTITIIYVFEYICNVMNSNWNRLFRYMNWNCNFSYHLEKYDSGQVTFPLWNRFDHSVCQKMFLMIIIKRHKNC